jgi:hypothetical protein
LPEKSGLPSAVRGAGAVKSGLPSAVLGTPAVGYGGHCAEGDGEMAAAIATAPIILSSDFILGLRIVLATLTRSSRLVSRISSAAQYRCGRV